MITAICPGSYDPVTNGHVDVISRAAAIFDRVVVGVVRDPHHKQTMFPLDERVAFLEDALQHLGNVTVDVFSELVVEFARKHDARTMVKGLRVLADFEWEAQMNQLNRLLAPDIETMYVMSSPRSASSPRAGSRRSPPSEAAWTSSSPTPSPAGFASSTQRTPWRAAQPGGVNPASTVATSKIPRPMDVLVLIDKLDDLVHNAKAVPLTDQVRIDREEIYDILDQMRATIPEEIKQARWIVKERQEMLAEAKRECDRLIGEAREQAVREASQTEIVKLAERQAQDIVDDARRQARETRLEMEDWADGILSTLEVNLDKFLGRRQARARPAPRALAGDGRRRHRPRAARRRRRRRVLCSGRPGLAVRPDPIHTSASSPSARRRLAYGFSALARVERVRPDGQTLKRRSRTCTRRREPTPTRTVSPVLRTRTKNWTKARFLSGKWGRGKTWSVAQPS